MSTMNAQAYMEWRKRMAQAAMGAVPSRYTNVVGGQSDTGLPPGVNPTGATRPLPKPAAQPLPPANVGTANRVDSPNPLIAEVNRDAVRYHTDPQAMVELRKSVAARQAPAQTNPDTVSGPNVTEGGGGTAPAAPAAPTASAQLDLRTELHRLAHERRIADRQGADPAELAKYHAAQGELRQMLMMQARIRSLEARGEITPAESQAKIAALEAQVGPARMAVAQSAGAASDRALDIRDRYPNAVTARRADEASRGFEDAVGRIDDPVNFSVQSGSTADPAQIRAELERMRSNPSENLASLRERDYRTPEEDAGFRFRRAMAERQIAEQEAATRQAEMGGGNNDAFYAAALGLPEGTPIPDALRPKIEADAMRYIEMRLAQGSRQAEQQAALADPMAQGTVAGAVNAIDAWRANPLRRDTQNMLAQELDRIDAMPPDQRQAAYRALAEHFGPSVTNRPTVPAGVIGASVDWLSDIGTYATQGRGGSAAEAEAQQIRDRLARGMAGG